MNTSNKNKNIIRTWVIRIRIEIIWISVIKIWIRKRIWISNKFFLTRIRIIRVMRIINKNDKNKRNKNTNKINNNKNKYINKINKN